MDRDTGPNRRRTDSTDERDVSQKRTGDREQELMSAYDVIDGREMFVIAAVDTDQAWIAISDSTEVDPTDWC
jgi:hypothetical protein